VKPRQSSFRALAASSKSAIWFRTLSCVVIHFAAHPPSKFWPKGVAAYSCAEWVRSRALAERSARRWRKEPYLEAIEILETRQA